MTPCPPPAWLSRGLRARWVRALGEGWQGASQRAGLQDPSSPEGFAGGEGRAAFLPLPAVSAAASRLFIWSPKHLEGRLIGEGDACSADLRVGARNEAARRLLFPGENVKRAVFPLPVESEWAGGGAPESLED